MRNHAGNKPNGIKWWYKNESVGWRQSKWNFDNLTPEDLFSACLSTVVDLGNIYPDLLEKMICVPGRSESEKVN